MNIPQKTRKPTKNTNETADVYLNSRSKNRYSVNYGPLKNRNNYDTLKTISRKSIEASNPKNATIQANQRQYYKRPPSHMRKQSNNRRY